MKKFIVSSKVNWQTSLFGFFGFLFWLTGQSGLASNYVNVEFLDGCVAVCVFLVSFFAGDGSRLTKLIKQLTSEIESLKKDRDEYNQRHSDNSGSLPQ